MGKVQQERLAKRVAELELAIERLIGRTEEITATLHRHDMTLLRTITVTISEDDAKWLAEDETSEGEYAYRRIQEAVQSALEKS